MQYTVMRGRPTSPGALLGVFGAVYRDVSSPWWFGFCVRLSWPGACGLGGWLAESAHKFSTMCSAAGPCVCTGACDRSGVASVLVLIGLSHDGKKSCLFGLAGGSPRRSSNGGKSESVDPTVCPRHPDPLAVRFRFRFRVSCTGLACVRDRVFSLSVS